MSIVIPDPIEIKAEIRNDKFILEFSAVPKLIFVSPEGIGKTDIVYIDGNILHGVRDISIDSPFEGATSHSATFCTTVSNNNLINNKEENK